MELPGLPKDLVTILHTLNQECNITVKTPFGTTNSFRVNNVWKQGGTWGPVGCAVQVDVINKINTREELGILLYNKIRIPALAFVDDTLNLSTCPVTCVQSNAIAEFVQFRKNLRFNIKKCCIVNLGAKTETPVLSLNNNDIQQNKQTTYLSEVIDGQNYVKATVEKRIKTALGTIAVISNFLNDAIPDDARSEICIVLYHSVFMSQLTFTSQVWGQINKTISSNLEKIQIKYFRTMYALPSSSCSVGILIIFGILPITAVIHKIQLNYLWNVVNRKNIVNHIFQEQKRNNIRGSWYQYIKTILRLYNLDFLDTDGITKFSKSQWAKMTKAAIFRKVHDDYLNRVLYKSKITVLLTSFLDNNYKIWQDNVDMMGLTRLPGHEASAYIRSVLRCLPIHHHWDPVMFYNNNIRCPLCKASLDTEIHFYECSRNPGVTPGQKLNYRLNYNI